MTANENKENSKPGKLSPQIPEPSGLNLRRLVQIGVVVSDLDQTTRLLTSLFGMGPFSFVEWPNRPSSKYQYRGVEEHIRIGQAFVQLGNVEVELIQPLAGERNAYKEFLDRDGGGIHHVLFEVPDIEVALQQMAEAGVTVLQSGTGIRPGTRWALLDTREKVGFYIELRHRPGDSDGSSVS
jgi:methylmalonyl-CoA/ethylmalonyl-CoA epimerase